MAADSDTALLLVSELVSNAILHARSTIRLTATSEASHLRVEVTDESARLPLARYYSPDATTGRGLHLVDRLADSWGFDTLGPAGKTVWFELGFLRLPRPLGERRFVQRRAGEVQPRVDLTGQEERPDASRAETTTVRLLRLPVRLHARAAEHHDGLVRELMLLATRSSKPGTTPLLLVRLIDELGDVFAEAPLEGQVRLRRAERDGIGEIDLGLEATPELARDAVRLLALLTEADTFCRTGELLTAAAPDDVLRFRSWYVDELVGQLNGNAPTPWSGPW